VLLGLLHGGTRDTYRSKSLPTQIAQNDWVGPVNALRSEFDQAPLE
jgi:hypothetical protein